MNKLLSVTTAVFVLGGMGVAVADISIGGNTRFRYEAWSDDQKDDPSSTNNNSQMGEDLNLVFNADMVADSGLEYGATIRLKQKQNGVDLNFIYLRGDFGRVVLGDDDAPSYSMTLANNWRGTGVGQITDALGAYKGDSTALQHSWLTTSGSARKFVYYTPNLSGFQGGVSYTDAGGAAKTDSLSYAAN